MRILFAGGGTAGHINPAISIADYFKAQEENFEALFIGTKRGLETKLVPKAGYDIKYIDIMGIDRKNPIKNVKVLYKLEKAKSDVRKIIKEFKPDAVVCTGGYVSGPVMIAAKHEGIPSVIHEQNVYPGLTVKGSQKYASYVLTSFEETEEHLQKGKSIVTGNPIRPEILKADKKRARMSLGLSDKPFVLVFGGSLGAGKINETMIGVLKKLAETKEVSLLFGTGDKNYEKVCRDIKDAGIELPDDINVVSYIDNMSEIMAACDIVVSRAGAITVSEIAALQKPSILIPSPNVVRNHQEQNAREFERNGGAKVITENELTSELLYDSIVKMAGNKIALLEMSQNVKKLAKTDALEKIYEVVNSIIKKD